VDANKVAGGRAECLLFDAIAIGQFVRNVSLLGNLTSTRNPR